MQLYKAHGRGMRLAQCLPCFKTSHTSKKHVADVNQTVCSAVSTISIGVESICKPVAFEYEGTEDLPFYSQFPLDRRAGERRKPAKLSSYYESDKARLVLISRDKVLVQANENPQEAGAKLAPVFLTPAAQACADFASPTAETIFLGLDADGSPYFAVEARDAAAALESIKAQAALPDLQWMSARNAGQDLDPCHASLLAVATALGQWNAASGFHPGTGSPTNTAAGGHGRKCSTTNASVYPRIDPAVIMLVTAGSKQRQLSGPAHMANDWCLLGRKAEWPHGRFSTLAGFMEVGEPLELSVAREVEEESGVTVDLPSVSYAASQPWPFPRSLMVGFYASAKPAHQQRQPSQVSSSQDTATTSSTNGDGSGAAKSWQPAADASGYDLLPPEGRRAAMDVGLMQTEIDEIMSSPLPQIHVDVKELEDCRWFHRDWLKACGASSPDSPVPGSDGFHIPGRWSLAYRLINTWLDYGAQPGQEPWAGDSIPQVSIDSGVFKYTLMRLRDRHAGSDVRHKLLVWGHTGASYHNDILQKAKAMATKHGLTVDVLGGGRIEHYPDQKVVSVYGYSAAFGAAPHEVTAALIRKWYPLYDAANMTVSYEGY